MAELSNLFTLTWMCTTSVDYVDHKLQLRVGFDFLLKIPQYLIYIWNYNLDC